MDPKQIMKQMIQFNKTTLDKTFDALNVLQEQTETMIASYMDQVPMLPVEGKKVINEWLEAYKKGRVDCKNTMEENYKKVEEFFASYDKAGK